MHPLLELKFTHSLRVAENANHIAEVLCLSETERYMAEGAGVVHDVGRFVQFVRYGSFRDTDTVDHGKEGRRVLEEAELSLVIDPRHREDLYHAVEYHNRRRTELPISFNAGRDRLLRILRDADKLDIMEVVLEAVSKDGFHDLPEMLPHIVLSRKISPGVMKAAQETNSLSIAQVATLSDFLILIATWFYDLNYPATRALAVQRDVLYRLRRQLPDTKAVGDLFIRIDETMSL